jgi:uncharacterized protein (UPF0333 family)
MSDLNPNRQDELTRRQFMTNAARAYLGVSILPVLGSNIATAAPTAAAVGKAKNVIYLYMSGGMSHIDTFDPKKNKDVMGLTNSIPTKVDDSFLGEYLPKTAGVMDKICVINSMNSTQGAHEQGSYIMHTSYAPRGTVVHPSLGAWVMKLGGRINPDIPGYVGISASQGLTGGGFFGAKYSAAPIGDAKSGLRDSRRPSEVSEEDFARRLSLADRMNKQFHSRYENTDVKSYEDLYSEAIRLMNSKDLKAFNLGAESQEMRELYGNGRFAQGCMLARRLVQHGVKFVEVGLGGWDTHYDNFTSVPARCKELDQAYAALITDLDKAGMLDSTLVVLATEFGRTPEINTAHSMGRDHHPGAFSCTLAGGGIKGGVRYGSTDSSGGRIRENPVTVQDFNATIAYALGLPTDLVMMSPSKRPFQIADKGKPITTLFG